jgi:hypothetical protein
MITETGTVLVTGDKIEFVGFQFTGDDGRDPEEEVLIWAGNRVREATHERQEKRARE